jgi:AcrR family transcriptional regulator
MFPQLTGGPRNLTPEQVGVHQRSRLEGAMVEAVARHGFAGTTVRELVTLAGVSKTTFYEHFDGKQACFLSTFDAIVVYVSAQVAIAYGTGATPREGLTAALERFVELVHEQPNAATLVAVDSLTLGTAGVVHRERSWEGFEELAGPALRGALSDVVVRAIVAGFTGVVYRRLRKDEADVLPTLVEPLVDWALGYQEAELGPDAPAMVAAATPVTDAVARAESAPSWEEPPASPRSRAELSQRERIVRAAAQVVAEHGYEGLSIPKISAAAGTSNQTFYEHFNSKRDAFLAAYESVANEALLAALTAFEGAADGPQAIGAGLRALLEHIAGHHTYARLAFFELATAGPIALDRADATTDLLISFLEPGRAPEGIDTSTPRVALEAIAAGIWAVIQREIGQGRIASLPEVAPQIAWIALAQMTRS